MNRFTLTRRQTLAAVTATLALPALAQSDKPVRFILPNATGSGVDAITRAAQPACPRRWATPSWWTTSPAPAASWACRRWHGRRPTA
jgi:hypothetical protein